MESIAVGKPYKGNYRQEGIKLEYNRGFSLNIFLKDLSNEEITDIRKGEYKFGLTMIEGVLFFTCSFGTSIEISDAPFHFGLYNDGRAKELPAEIPEGKGLALNVMAVDARTGTVKALRLIGLPTEFSRKLIEIALHQSKLKVTSEEIDTFTNSVQTFMPSSRIYEMAVVKC